MGKYMGFVQSKKGSTYSVKFCDSTEAEQIKLKSIRRAVTVKEGKSFLLQFQNYVARVKLQAYTAAGVHVHITPLKATPAGQQIYNMIGEDPSKKKAPSKKAPVQKAKSRTTKTAQRQTKKKATPSKTTATKTTATKTTVTKTTATAAETTPAETTAAETSKRKAPTNAEEEPTKKPHNKLTPFRAPPGYKQPMPGAPVCYHCHKAVKGFHVCPGCKCPFHNLCMLSFNKGENKICTNCFEKGKCESTKWQPDSHMHDPYNKGAVPFDSFTKNYFLSKESATKTQSTKTVVVNAGGSYCCSGVNSYHTRMNSRVSSYSSRSGYWYSRTGDMYFRTEDRQSRPGASSSRTGDLYFRTADLYFRTGDSYSRTADLYSRTGDSV